MAFWMCSIFREHCSGRLAKVINPGIQRADFCEMCPTHLVPSSPTRIKGLFLCDSFTEGYATSNIRTVKQTSCTSDEPNAAFDDRFVIRYPMQQNPRGSGC
jgi:hypothetical protein